MDDQERIPPAKIRTTRLQEAQTAALVALEQQCAAMYYEAGVDPAEVRPRSEIDIIRLRQRHNVFVAEADHHPAGYLAWRDEAPGVAVLATLNVGPDYQRFGIGTALLRDLGSDAKAAGIRHVVAWCWPQASWAVSFLRGRGFQPLEGSALPEAVSSWQEAISKNEDEDEAPKPGQVCFWRETEDLGVLALPGVPTPR